MKVLARTIYPLFNPVFEFRVNRKSKLNYWSWQLEESITSKCLIPYQEIPPKDWLGKPYQETNKVKQRPYWKKLWFHSLLSGIHRTYSLTINILPNICLHNGLWFCMFLSILNGLKPFFWLSGGHVNTRPW